MEVVYKNIINFFAVCIGLFFFGNGLALLLPAHYHLAIYNPYWPEHVLINYGLGLYGRFVGYVFMCLGFALFTLKFRLVSACILWLVQINMLVIAVCNSEWMPIGVVVGLLVFTSFILIKDRRTLQVFMGIRTQLFVYKPDNNEHNLLWVVGFLTMISSIQLAKNYIYVAYAAIAVGCLLSLWAYWLDSKKPFEPL